MPASAYRVPRSPRRWRSSAPIRSPISSTPTGTSIMPTATNGCIRSAPRSSRRRIPASTFPRSSGSRTGTTISFRCRPARIPSEVFANERSLKLNGASISLKHYGPAHTDSDISVTFGEADIVHVGDTFWNGIYPFIDYSTGGSIDGMIAASDANLAATTDDTIIIPGHGKPVSNRAELQEFRDMLVGDPGQRREAQEARDDRATRPSRPSRPPPLTRSGASSSSIPASSPGWSTRASDRGPGRPQRRA